MVNTTRPKRLSGEKTTEKPTRASNAPTLDRQLKIQKALYEIADAASAVTDMQSFYQKLHKIVGKLMYARNFFIALYDKQSDLITWPYYVDTVDKQPLPPMRLSDQHGATGWILRNGKTLADVNGSVASAMKRREIFQVGTDSDGIGVPLQDDGGTIGVLLVQSYKANIKYSLQDIQILNFVAQHISTALVRARAIEEIRQQNTELEVINRVQEGLASSLDIQSIYTLVGDKIREIFAADTTFIAYRDEEKNQLLAAYYTDRNLRRSFNRPYGTGIAEAIIESGRPLLLRSALEHRKFGAHHISSPGTNKDLNQSVLGAPVFRNNKAYGAVSIQSYQVNAFDKNDLRLLQTLTNSMSVALENARLFDETQQRNAELTIINSVQEGLASKLDMQAIYELVGDKIRRTFNAQVVTIDTYEHDVHSLHGRYYFEAGTVSSGATYPCFGFRKHVIENRKPIIINSEMLRWMKEYDNPVIQGLQPKSAIFIPMIVGGEAMGVISLQNNDQENAFPETDVRLLTTLANSMSIALENARLWEQEKLYRKALERELEIGREIQNGFLPDSLPQVNGWEIAATLMSAREVAGDFYDAFELPGGNIGLVIADVCDKGVGAALFMTLFRSLIRAATNLDFFEHTEQVGGKASVTERLQRAILLTNNYIAETHGASGMFATIFFGILNPCDGKLVYINGGHEPPFVIRSGVVDEVLHKTGSAVGVITDCRFQLLETRLGPGDILYAFTDGVPDCRNPLDEEFGRDRLIAILQRDYQSARGLVEATETDLRQYIAGATQFDDITLLAVQRGPHV